MSSAPRRFQAMIAAGLMVAVTALSVAVPLLDRGRELGTRAFTEPGAATGYVDHHHSVCVQHGAAAWYPVGETPLPSARLVREDDASAPVLRRTACTARTLPFSRAPPRV
ncbi:MAG: hypothetical protein ACN0LA_07555 [Candidatus Longimicrobiales bacterium M2_2A_002]